MQITFTITDLNDIAKQLYLEFKEIKVWAFYASMGCGKTTLINALCSYLQVQDATSSPTFSIINQYKSPIENTIYHMDWYRLKGEEEAIEVGVEDYLHSGKLCLVEWPSVAEGLLPNNYLQIEIEIVNENTRTLRAEINSN